MSIHLNTLRISYMCLAASFAFGAGAQQPEVSFSDLETRLRAHPGLDALHFSAMADRERAGGALGLPDPVVSIGLNNFPIFSPSFTEYLPTNKYVGVRQAIPNVAKRKAKSLKSLKSAAQTDLETEMQFGVLRGELIQLLIEKQKNRELRELATQRDSKYSELLGIIEIEINAGRPDVYRLADVEVERTEVARTLSELSGADADIDARLIDLVDTAPNTSPPPLSVRDWQGNALGFYAVRLADAEVDVTDAGIAAANADFKPDWGVNLTYQQRQSGNGGIGSNFDGDDWVSGGVSFTVPLWSSKRQGPNLRAAKIEKDAAKARRAGISRRVLSQWKRFDARRKVSDQNVQILNTKITAIEDRMASRLITYETGTGDYSPIVDGEIAILKLRAQIVSEIAKRDQAIAQMNSLLVGSKS